MFSLDEGIRALYEPQLEQLGMTVRQDRLGLVADGFHEWGRGYLRALPITKNAALFFLELTTTASKLIYPASVPYVCASAMSYQSARLMPMRMSGASRGTDLIAAYAFSGENAPFSIEANSTYASTSFCFLPSFFDDMNARFSDGFDTLFEELLENPSDEVPGELAAIMRSLSLERTFRPGALPYFQSKGLLVASILNDHAKERLCPENLEGSARQRNLVRQAQSYIDRNLGAAPSIEEIAEALYVSKSHVCAAFKRETGTTIARWTSDLRIERSLVLMENPANSLSHIAHSVGFSHLSSFSKAFKQTLGISPSAWRNKNR